jgi:hypothetical protein
MIQFTTKAMKNRTCKCYNKQTKTKEQYDKKGFPHTFRIGDKVLISYDFDTTKNPKLVPNWKRPAEIIDINDTNAQIKLKNKIKVLSVAKLKHFFKNVKKSEDEAGDASQNLIQIQIKH